MHIDHAEIYGDTVFIKYLIRGIRKHRIHQIYSNTYVAVVSSLTIIGIVMIFFNLFWCLIEFRI